MKSQKMIDYAAPLQELEETTPSPAGDEVLVKISHCGVCHSDLHIFDGYFNMGGDNKLDVTKGRKLPFTLGHEIVGEVVAVGDNVKDAAVGDRRIVYPWIGCGECPICASGNENLCNKPHQLGINVDGGYSDHVMVPDENYLVDFSGVDEALSCTYACSGLTAYSAINKVLPAGEQDPILILGAGGVGMMGVQFAKAMTGRAPLVADIDDAKLDAAKAQGVENVYNTTNPESLKQLLEDTQGGVHAVIDFVGAEASFGFANGAVRKGGKIVIVGLFGGAMGMPLPLFPMRQISIGGSFVGTLQEMKDMMVLVREGKIDPIPLDKRPMSQAYQSLEDLRNGKVTGRVVLEN